MRKSYRPMPLFRWPLPAFSFPGQDPNLPGLVSIAEDDRLKKLITEIARDPAGTIFNYEQPFIDGLVSQMPFRRITVIEADRINSIHRRKLKQKARQA